MRLDEIISSPPGMGRPASPYERYLNFSDSEVMQAIVAALKTANVEFDADWPNIRFRDFAGFRTAEQLLNKYPGEPARAIDTRFNFLNSNGARSPRTFTSQFKAWFGKSKVVSSDGTPRIVYHGTANDFEAFDTTKAGSATGADDAHLGFWFAANPQRANDAAEHAACEVNDDACTGVIMPVYLRLLKPKMFKGMIPDTDIAAAKIKAARANGHDGVIWEGGEWLRYGMPSGHIYLVFSPKQIKSVHNANPTNAPGLLERESA